MLGHPVNEVQAVGALIIIIGVLLAAGEVALERRRWSRHTGNAMRSSWESRRGELDREWTWFETLVLWFVFIVMGIAAGIFVING